MPAKFVLVNRVPRPLDSMITLLDANGVPVRKMAADCAMTQTPGRVSGDLDLLFQPSSTAREPYQLQFVGRRDAYVDVPFTLKNVPLR